MIETVDPGVATASATTLHLAGEIGKLRQLRVLEIEPSRTRKGESELLYYEKGKPPLVIDSAAAAARLIDRHRDELLQRYPVAAERPELNYLILWPRESPLYPLAGELENYESWFTAHKAKYTLDLRTRDGP